MKDHSFRNFFISGVILGIVLVLLSIAAQKVFPDKSFHSIYFIVPFVLMVTNAFHFSLMKASLTAPRSFVGKFMAFSGVKLLLYMIVLLLYAFFVKQEVVSFLLLFFLTYILYTILEIASILKFLKKIGS